MNAVLYWESLKLDEFVDEFGGESREEGIALVDAGSDK